MGDILAMCEWKCIACVACEVEDRDSIANG